MTQKEQLQRENDILRLELALLLAQNFDQSEIQRLTEENHRLQRQIDKERQRIVSQHIACLSRDS